MMPAPCSRPRSGHKWSCLRATVTLTCILDEMNAAQKPHPTDETLYDYGLGTLAGAVAEWVNEQSRRQAEQLDARPRERPR